MDMSAETHAAATVPARQNQSTYFLIDKPQVDRKISMVEDLNLPFSATDGKYFGPLGRDVYRSSTHLH